jgi:acyl-CoA dehydrogenase
MYLLERVARPDQIAEHLVPMVEGRTRSAFAMTEPGGAGSDPGQLATEATFDGTSYRLDGRKWLITGAVGAQTWILMAKVLPNEHGPDGPTLFLADAGTPGLRVERVMGCIDRNSVGGHSVVALDGVELAPTAVLGEVGAALRHAQLRLAPARLTHCMRWLGAASRAQSIALAHARTRTSFGAPLGQHQGVSFMLAENEIALHQCRLAIWHAAWLLDRGEKARHESSMVKVLVSEELFKVADRCVQILGGQGVSDETPVQQIFRDIRAFRIYDGPTEVHKFAIGRRLVGTS